MGSWATASALTNKFIPLSVSITESSMNSKLSTSFHKLYRSKKKGKFSLSFSRDNYKVESNGETKSARKVSYLQTWKKQGAWEEPDIDSDSDNEFGDDEDEEVEDENLGFESDWEEEESKTSAITDVSITSTDKYEEQVKRGTFLVLVSFSLLEWFGKLDRTLGGQSIGGLADKAPGSD